MGRGALEQARLGMVESLRRGAGWRKFLTSSLPLRSCGSLSSPMSFVIISW